MSVHVPSFATSRIQNNNDLWDENGAVLFKQAVVDQDESAWQIFCQRFQPVIQTWITEITKGSEDEVNRKQQVEQVFAKVRTSFARHPQKFYDYPSHQACIGLLYRITQRVVVPMLLIATLLSYIQMTQQDKHNVKQSVSRVATEYERQKHEAEAQIANWGQPNVANSHQTVDYPVFVGKGQMATL